MKMSEAKIGMPVLVKVSTRPGDYYFARAGDVGLIVSTKDSNQVLLCPEGHLKYVSHSYTEPEVYQLLEGDAANTLLSKLRVQFDDVNRNFTLGPSICMGSDPEIFAVDENDVVIPAFKFLPNKAEKQRVFPGEHTFVFWDGFQAELTHQEATCHESVVRFIRKGLLGILKGAKTVNSKARLTYQSVIDVPYQMMCETSEEHASLGCSPSKNVYPGVEPIHVEIPKMLSCRFAGCHVHLGYPNLPENKVSDAVKMMDAIAGVASVALFRNMEDPRRRRFYGKAGEYRLPPHGIEYRVLSSATLAHPVLTFLMFDLTRAACKAGLLGFKRWWDSTDDEVQSVINNYDVDGATAILSRNTKFLNAMLEHIYADQRGVKNALKLLDGGAQRYLPLDFSAWDLAGDGYFDLSGIKVATVRL
jgi:hypothetical protein